MRSVKHGGSIYKMIQSESSQRLQNTLDLEIVSEKNYDTDIEAMNITVGMRTMTKIVLDIDELTPLLNFFKAATPTKANGQEDSDPDD